MAWRRRDFHQQPPAIPGIVRVDCIGDSMMHGAGALPGQSFPAHFGRQLNAAFPNHLFHAVNFGLEGGNIWNTWSLFKGRWREGQCDAVVLSVCSNDIRVLEWWDVDYDYSLDDVRWSDQGLGHVLLIRLLDEIDRFIAETAVPVVIFFFDICVWPQAFAVALDQVFGGRRFTFLKVFSDLRPQLDAVPPAERTIPHDGHPSSQVHEIVARHMARIIKRDRSFGDLPAAADDAAVMPRAVVAALDAMIESGTEGDAALGWAEEVLTAKEPALRRSVPLDRLDDLAAAVAAARDLVDRRAALWTHGLLQPQEAARTMRSCPAWSDILVALDIDIQAVEELATELELAADDEELSAELAALLIRSNWVREWSRSRSTAVLRDMTNWQASLALLGNGLDQAMEGAFNPPGLTDAGPIGRWAGAELASWRRRLDPAVRPIRQAHDRLKRVLARLDGLRDRADPAPAAALALAYDRASLALMGLMGLVVGVESLRRPWMGRYARFWTRIEVSFTISNPLESCRPGLQLGLSVHYDLPQRLSVFQSQHMGLVKSTESYVFEFPLLVHGDLVVEIKNFSDDPEILTACGVSLDWLSASNQRMGDNGLDVIERRIDGPRPDFTQVRVDGVRL